MITEPVRRYVKNYRIDNVSIERAEIVLICTKDNYIRCNMFHRLDCCDNKGQETWQQLGFQRFFYYHGENKDIPFEDLTNEEIEQILIYTCMKTG